MYVALSAAIGLKAYMATTRSPCFPPPVRSTIQSAGFITPRCCVRLQLTFVWRLNEAVKGVHERFDVLKDVLPWWVHRKLARVAAALMEEQGDFWPLSARLR